MKRPEDAVLEYFSNAPLQQAELLLHIVTGTIKRRQPTTLKADGKKRKQLSPEARQKIAEAQRLRWSKPPSPSESKAAD